jgi:hypothetical protein
VRKYVPMLFVLLIASTMTSFLQLGIQQAHAAERPIKVGITNFKEMNMNHTRFSPGPWHMD